VNYPMTIFVMKCHLQKVLTLNLTADYLNKLFGDEKNDNDNR